MTLKHARRKLYQYVVDEVGLRIVRGDYPSGETLPNEEKLCKEFEVSRGVLREAMKVLIQKGLIESKPRIGSRILPRSAWNLFDPDVLIWKYQAGDTVGFLKNIMEVRQIIEAEAARFAAERADESAIKRIRTLYDKMADLIATGSLAAAEDLSVLDLQFHTAILEASGNELLLQIGYTMRQALLTARENDRQDLEGQKALMPSHLAIVNAIAAHDAATAYRLAREHISQVWKEIQDTLSDQ